MRIGKKGIVLLAALLAVTGCSRTGSGEGFAPTEDSLYITGEGTVTSAVIEDCSGDIYDETELREYVENLLADFNGGSGEDVPVSIRECEILDGTAKLVLDFRDADSYIKFTEEYPDEESQIRLEDLSVMDMEQAVSAGYMDGLKLVSSDKKSVSADSVRKKSRLKVARLDGSAVIRTDGAIRYVSEGVELTGKCEARVSSDTESYIIFK